MAVPTPLPPTRRAPPGLGRQALALPKDWAVLYHTHGLRSFLAVPIGTTNETLGLLTVAKQEAHAFDDEWCAIWTDRANTTPHSNWTSGLQPQLRG